MPWFVFLLLLGAAAASSDHHSRPARSMLEDDPCLDANHISHPEDVHLPARYRNLTRPWVREDVHARIFTSLGLQYQWSWVESLPIRGLTPSTTIGDIVRWLDGRNCSFLATGPAVWETLHRVKPVSISGETSCSLSKLYSWCMTKFQAHSCGLYPLDQGGFRLEIGDARTNTSIEELRAEPLQLFEWGHVLSKPRESWAYSVDAMGIYDNQAGQVYLLDLSGRGYTDICEKKISPAVEEPSWKRWADAPVDKMLQFYQLRWQGFSAANHDFEKFVNKLIAEKATRKDIQSFYCENLLGGVVSYVSEEVITGCHVVFPEAGHLKRIAQAKEIMSHELGAVYPEMVKPAIDEMEAIYVTAKQFVERRDVLKRRLSRPEPRADQPHLVLGEPLVGDISEVHRRPILSKAVAITDLPPDFPSGPKAVPDQNGGFREQSDIHQDILQQEPEGAGGGFQHETYGAGEDEDDSDEETGKLPEEDPPPPPPRNYVPERRAATSLTSSFPSTLPVNCFLLVLLNWFLL